MLLGLVRPTSGTATIDGRVVRATSPDPLGTVGAALEATDFHPGRSGRDHLRVLAAAAGIPDSRVDEMLDPDRHPRVRAAPGGRLLDGDAATARAGGGAARRPAVLILDEPANGLDPEGIRWLRGFLRHLSADQGKTILVSSHLLQEVEQTVDDVVIIANGILVKQGTMAELGGGGGAVVRTSDPNASPWRCGEAGPPTSGGRRPGPGRDRRPAPGRRGRPPTGLPVWELSNRERPTWSSCSST